MKRGDFPGSPVVKTLPFQCRQHELDHAVEGWEGELRSHMPSGIAKKKVRKVCLSFYFNILQLEMKFICFSYAQ